MNEKYLRSKWRRLNRTRKAGGVYPPIPWCEYYETMKILLGLENA